MNILDLLIPLLIIGVSLFLSAKKKSRQTQPREPYSDDENPEWDTQPEEYKWETILQKAAKNDLNPPFYGDFEKIENRKKEVLKKEPVYVQNIELEKETDESFLISHEEMRKAIIYSEILKRPHF